MLTPYDWQEGIGHRAQYIEAKIAQGAPVLGLSINDGIVFFTYRKQASKIYEIYDRLIFGAIGQQSDIEGLRVAAIDFAHQEGYNRSEEDVTIQRVVTALSAPLKKAFADFSSAPFVARTLFAEVGRTPEEDQYYVLDYDGDYSLRKNHAYVTGTEESASRLKEGLEKLKPTLSIEKALEGLTTVWGNAMESEGEDPTSGLTLEAVLLERSGAHENRFRRV